MKKAIILLTLGFMLMVLSATSVLAVNGTTIIVGQNDSSFAGSSGASLTGNAGNITNVTVNQTLLSSKWQAFYGDVFQTIILGDNSGNNVYDWGATAIDGWLFFSNASSVTWSSVAAVTTNNHLEAEDSLLGFDSLADVDSVNQTFNTVITHDGIQNVGAGGIAASSSRGVETNDGSGAAFWDTVILTENVAQPLATKVYATRVNQTTANNNYRNVDVDYQALLPTNASGRTYFVYAELYSASS